MAKKKNKKPSTVAGGFATTMKTMCHFNGSNERVFTCYPLFNMRCKFRYNVNEEFYEIKIIAKDNEYHVIDKFDVHVDHANRCLTATVYEHGTSDRFVKCVFDDENDFIEGINKYKNYSVTRFILFGIYVSQSFPWYL